MNAPTPGSGSAPNNASASQPSGTYFLGRYRVVDEIGIGGMASVHLARMDGPGGFQKWIAIKRIHPHLVEDESFIQMFLDEARVAARISHPNVATVFELGKEADSFWIAMEYLHGEPLREIMRRTEELGTPMPPEIACRIIADAAEGLHAAHELLGRNGEKLNLVHRDVTPHNLFVTYDGATKVVDFGIAKFSSRMASTRAGTLKGKLAYMSPEQVAGEALDRRTDIFALGVVLWELTTGQRLFRMDSDLDTLAKVQECNVPRPSSIIRGYPLELERVAQKALAKNKNERYRTARELSRALQSMLMKRGLFIASDEVSTYIRSIFGDRIEKREAHLRWAAEVTQTIDVDAAKAPVPDFEGSVQSYDSDVQRATGKNPIAQPQPQAQSPAAPRAAAPRMDMKATLPLATRSAAAAGPPRPAAGAVAARPNDPPPLADLETMEDDGPTIMAPTPTGEDDYDDEDATVVAAAKPDIHAAPAVRPAAGARSVPPDDGDPTRAHAAPVMNAAVAVPPRPLPQRAPEQQHSPPVVVEARPQMQMPPNQNQSTNQNMPMYSPVAFAPTYAPNDPRLGGPPPPGYPMQQMQPMQNFQQPTMLVPTPRTGVPMWLVGAVSGVAALMVLLVVYLLVVPPHPQQQRIASTGSGSTATTGSPTVAVTAGNGPFGAARGAFGAALSPTGTTTASSSLAQPLPTTTATDQPTATASTTTAPTTTTAVTAATTATATATAAVATSRPTGPTQIPTNVDKGYLTLVTVPRCDSWSDNGTPIGTCPIVNKPLPVGAHRITLTTNVPKATKTISVIIISGQLSNPPLVMLSQ